MMSMCAMGGSVTSIERIKLNQAKLLKNRF